MNRRLVLCTAFFALSSAFVVSAAETPTAFLQRFYDSYLKQKTPDWGGTVKTKRSLFTSTLADALQEDAAAQAKVTGDIVGIDFDPFLGSQDPSNRFVVRDAVPTPTGYRVKVYYLGSGSRNGPAVLVDVSHKDGSWIIADFHYPQTSSDLLSILRSLRQSRASSHKR